MLNQTDAPLLAALLSYPIQDHVPFYMPGHKRGKGIPSELLREWGSSVFQADLTELPELDHLFAPSGVIEEAQQLASAAFGGEKTWFLINGTTCGIIAAILASCNPGDRIILPRNVHKSAIAGLILSGAIPIFINPEYDSSLDITYSITPQLVREALQQYPDAKAVLMVYPTYYGLCGNVAEIAKITHQYNIPLLVDEAHGAHFNFHPDLPISALASGADLTVQSTHKVLAAMTQASMLHVQGNLINQDKISKALALVQSSSPSYPLMASLDAARRQMALQGKQLITDVLKLCDRATIELSQIPGLSVIKLPKPKLNDGFFDLDQTRLTVTVSDLGLSGDEADDILHQKLGITAELTSLKNITFIITFGNTETDIDRLIEAFRILAKDYRRSQITQSFTSEILLPPISVPAISPREAFFAPTETVPIEMAVNRLGAELVCPYPPGIPLLMPGEEVSASAILSLQKLYNLGVTIAGCNDSTLQTLKVLK